MIINDTKWNRRPTCVVYEWLTEKQIEEIKEFIMGTSKNRFPNLDFALQIRNFTNFEYVKRIQTENSL